MSRPPSGRTGRRVALVYDCLFPWTVGGAERWYRALAGHLVEEGHGVAYLTRRQWDEPPDLPGIQVEAVSGSDQLYDRSGTRRIGPTLRYGVGVLRHLLAHRQAYDIVQVSSFPFWSVLAARLALVGTGVPLVVDWHELWGWRFWRSYAGNVSGTLGFFVQRLCIGCSSYPIVSSSLNASRFVDAGGRTPTVLFGYFPTPLDASEPAAAEQHPYALVVGRHIADKGIDLVPAVARALRDLQPPMQMVVTGDGPLRHRIEEEVRAAGLGATVRFTGFVDESTLEHLMGAATCLVVLSRREGYGLVALEAMRRGTPAVVAAFPENLAVGHVVAGVNGVVATPTPACVAASIQQVADAGPTLRRSTMRWFEAAAVGATMERSLEQVVALHARAAGDQDPSARSNRAADTVVAVVLNYNNAAFTAAAVASILDQEPAPAVVVVDNGSSPAEAAALRRVLPEQVEILELTANAGIPGALGQGLQRALDSGATEVLVQLNDTALEPGSLKTLRRRLDDDAGIGVVAPLQVLYDDPETVVTSGSRLHRGAWLVSARDHGRLRADVQAEAHTDPDYVDFTCLLVRAEVLRQVGLPYPGFRFYWDDTEWGIRVRRAGWRLTVDCSAVVRHRVSGTLATTMGGPARYYQYRNRLLAKRRLDGRVGVARLIVQEPVLLAARALLRGSDGGGTLSQAKALADYLRSSPYPDL